MVVFFAHIPFVVNCAFSATTAERLQQYVGENMKRAEILDFMRRDYLTIPGIFPLWIEELDISIHTAH